MDKVRCLYLEDNPVDQKRYALWIEDDWKHFHPDVPIVVTIAPTLEESISQLDTNAYDLFVADIFLGDKTFDGLRAISRARKSSPDIGIVSLSTGSPGLDDKCRNAGADECVTKAFIAENPELHDLGRKIVAALDKHGKVPHATPTARFIADASNLELGALVDVIGKTVIIGLVDQITKTRSTEICAFFVRPGLSGASVLRVDCDIEVQDPEPPRRMNLLVKLSRFPQSLRLELDKDKSQFPEGLFVNFFGPMVESGGWAAIAARFQPSCATLSEWVRMASSAADVPQVFQGLFLEGGLGDVYSQLGYHPSDRPSTRIISDSLTLSRRSRIRSAAREFQTLLRRHDPEGWFDPIVLEHLIGGSSRVVDLVADDFPAGVSSCLSHGDLHGRNILVKKVPSPRAVLIDPANIENFHWSSDLARLTADLALSVVDAGDASHEWECMPVWQEILGTLIRGEEIQTAHNAEENAGVFSALNWISANWSQIYRATDPRRTPRWEFVLGLAAELLRSSYRVADLPTPKRVLALTAGCEAIRQAARDFKNVV